MKNDTKICIGALLLGGLATYYYAGYHALKNAATKKEIINHRSIRKSDLDFLRQVEFEDLSITTFDDLTLKGKFLPANTPSDKVVILVHGYHSTNFREFAHFLKFYHNLNYHILMPNNRAHGDSEGEYVGFGWLDRLDIMEWIHEIQQHFNFQPLQIVLHGISMGGATVLMTGGETLSQDVKCIISDCAYTSALDEFKDVLHEKDIPPFLLIPNAKRVSKKAIGFDIEEASALKQVKKTKIPTLFIHGDQDKYVKPYMAYELYNACASEKDLLIVEGAGHAQSYQTNPQLYEMTVKNFLKRYIS